MKQLGGAELPPDPPQMIGCVRCAVRRTRGGDSCEVCTAPHPRLVVRQSSPTGRLQNQATALHNVESKILQDLPKFDFSPVSESDVDEYPDPDKKWDRVKDRFKKYLKIK